MSSVEVMELMQKIPRKERDIEGIKEEYRRKKEQLEAKCKAELAGIEEKVGQLLELRVEELNIALEILAATQDEVKKARQRLAQTKDYKIQTKAKARKAVEDAKKALKREIDAEIDAIQREIRATQQLIREKGKVYYPQ